MSISEVSEEREQELIEQLKRLSDPQKYGEVLNQVINMLNATDARDILAMLDEHDALPCPCVSANGRGEFWVGNAHDVKQYLHADGEWRRGTSPFTTGYYETREEAFASIGRWYLATITGSDDEEECKPQYPCPQCGKATGNLMLSDPPKPAACETCRMSVLELPGDKHSELPAITFKPWTPTKEPSGCEIRKAESALRKAAIQFAESNSSANEDLLRDQATNYTLASSPVIAPLPKTLAGVPDQVVVELETGVWVFKEANHVYEFGYGTGVPSDQCDGKITRVLGYPVFNTGKVE